MSFDATFLQHPDKRERRSWHGAAFIVEALVLMVFLIASVTVTVQVMSASHEHGAKAAELSTAIVLASNAAEAFAADPASGDLTVTQDDYTLTRSVEREAQDAGTLYRAHIAVAHGSETIYELDTARYVSDAPKGVH